MVIEYHEAAFAHGILEVAYRELDDGSIFVFHAMPCRQKWLAAANEEEKHG